MKKVFSIYSEADHTWQIITRDPEKPNYLIDTNEYLITKGKNTIITDPGGSEIFPAVVSSLSTSINPKSIEYIFASHQDPDIVSSLSLWLDMNEEIKCFASRIWTSFLPHFGGNNETFISIPDNGMKFNFYDLELEFVPAHYLHSSGNFHIYDSKAKLYFSGDIGAALLPHDYLEENDIYVQDFDNHIQYCKGFHQRWMGSNEAKLDWCERVSKYNIDLLCPQHGLIFRGKDVMRFINWFSELKVGVINES
ncbi:MAG: MBL fold metallo-hydrolase [Leptospiraceae bacterium]|nr:MBL fold metallo-hydrolase [Leptospiraceae bacterium]